MHEARAHGDMRKRLDGPAKRNLPSIVPSFTDMILWVVFGSAARYTWRCPSNPAATRTLPEAIIFYVSAFCLLLSLIFTGELRIEATKRFCSRCGFSFSHGVAAKEA